MNVPDAVVALYGLKIGIKVKPWSSDKPITVRQALVGDCFSTSANEINDLRSLCLDRYPKAKTMRAIISVRWVPVE